MSISWPLDVDPPPQLVVVPEDAASLDEGEAAIELWEHYSGKRLDATQRLTVLVMMAVDEAGRWAAATTGREMPRQNGKGDELEVVELWGLTQRGERILHTIHDAVLLATQTQERMLGLIEGHPDLRRRMLRRWTGTGQQMIEMRDGAIIWYRTRTGGGGRGIDDIDRLVVDEAQHVTAGQLAAITPTGFVNRNTQRNFAGTAGLEGQSMVWWKQRRRALEEHPGRFGYVGHTAERLSVDQAGNVVQDVPDLADEAIWWQVNPALKRLGEDGLDFLREQFRVLGPVMFAQEHLGVWCAEPTSQASGPIPEDVWSNLVDGQSHPDDDRPVCLSLDVSPDRAWASFGLAGQRTDGLWHVEIRDRRAGTAWILERARELTEGHDTALLIDPRSPAGSLIVPLQLAGIDVTEVPGDQYRAACGRFVDAVNNARLRHIGHPDAWAAIANAQIRPSGESWVWSRRTSTADICGLVAMTLAFGGAEVHAPTPERRPWVIVD